jgi:muramoyltetrapeptide carboxypeptidase LdcA involved in peptidoglycan recycling
MVTKPSGTEYADMKMKPIDDLRAPGDAARLARPEAKHLIFATSSSTIIFLKTLAKNVAARLRERAFCVVFEDDLDRCWPRRQMARAERQREIQGFAESQGWAAAIVEGGFGTRAIFRKLEEGAAN